MKRKEKSSLGLVPILKTLSKSIREYKKPSILAPIFVMMEVILEVLIPYVMTLLLGEIRSFSTGEVSHNFITRFFLGNNCEEIFPIIMVHGLVLLAIALLSLTCGVLSGKYCAKASMGFLKNLRKDMFHKIQDFSFANVDKFSAPSLVTRLTTDAGNVAMSYMMIIRTAVRAPFMLIFALVMAFSINVKMALIFLCTAPLLAFGLFLITRKAIPFFNRIFPKYDKLNESVDENIRGMRVVKSYVREDYEKKKFDIASANVKDEFTKAEKIVALNGPLMNTCIYTGVILIYIVGSSLIINSNQAILQFTELQAFMTYSFQILMSLMMLSMIMVMLIISYASSKRIAEILNEESTLTSPENAITEIKNGSIEFNNVCFKYYSSAEKFALENINLQINSGETVGIIGATGSAKSTLVSLIPRLYDVTEGEVKVSGINVKDYDLNTLRNNVSMVLQKNVLFSGTIKSNMKWGKKDATDDEIHNALKMAQIDVFPLDKEVEQGGNNFSGGQKQRLCIARALLKNPKIIIFDDSTSAVDTKTDALIRHSLKTYIPSTTKIIIAQRIASVMDADKIVILDGGKIVAIGNHKQLLKNNEIYKELYYSQNTHAKEVE